MRAGMLRRGPGRHAAGRANGSPAPTPSHGPPGPAAEAATATVVVQPEVLRSIAIASVDAGRRETGGPLVGTIQRSWNGTDSRLLVAILGTVPPGPAPRAGASWVAMGSVGDGERAASALRWWRAVTGLDLRHLGDWHLHHPAAPEPSEGDRRTAAAMADGTGLWLVAVSVARRHQDEEIGAHGNLARISRAAAALQEVRFYRQVPVAGLRPIPVRTEDATIPGLPTLPWHVTDPVRSAMEFRLLRDRGFSVAIDPVRPDGRLGLAVRIGRPGHRSLTVLTGVRYPLDPPSTVDPATGRLKVRDPWSPSRFLVDLAEEAGR